MQGQLCQQKPIYCICGFAELSAPRRLISCPLWAFFNLGEARCYVQCAHAIGEKPRSTEKGKKECLLSQFGELWDTRQETYWNLRGNILGTLRFLFLLKISAQNAQASYQEVWTCWLVKLQSLYRCSPCSVLTVLPFGPQLFHISFRPFTISGSTKGSSYSETKLKPPWSDRLWVLQYCKRTLSIDESGCMSVFNVIAMMMSSRRINAAEPREHLRFAFCNFVYHHCVI